MTAPVRDSVLGGAVHSGAREALDRFFAARDGHASPDHRALWSALQDAADGGKQVRPALFATVYRGLGGTDDDVAAEVAAALELLHTALVIHDDVIDGDTLRRGRANVSGTFRERGQRGGLPPEAAAQYGDAAAILAGDLALTGAVRLIASCGAQPGTVARLLDHLDHALQLSAAGELADVRLSLFGGTDLAESITMEQHKTAAYSFALPLRLAAVLAGADEKTAESLERFARLLGVAYQMRDDLDGIFGDEAVTGKSTLSDVRRGTFTPLIGYARETDLWPSISRLLGAPTTDEAAAARLRGLLDACGARRRVEEHAAELGRAAREAVAHLSVASLLHAWADTVTTPTEEER